MTRSGESSDDESRGSLGVNQIIGSRSEIRQEQIEDDDFGSDDSFEHLEDVRRTGVPNQDDQENKFDLPKPIYDEVINIGNVSGFAKLDQVMEQLYIKPSEYIYWNSKDTIKIKIPDTLYHCKVSMPRPQSTSKKS